MRLIIGNPYLDHIVRNPDHHHHHADYHHNHHCDHDDHLYDDEHVIDADAKAEEGQHRVHRGVREPKK